MKVILLATPLVLIALQSQALELECEFGSGDGHLVRHYTLSDTKNIAGVTIGDAVFSATQASDGFQSNIETAISIPSSQRVETMVSKNGTAFLMIATYIKQEDGSEIAKSMTLKGKCE